MLALKPCFAHLLTLAMALALPTGCMGERGGAPAGGAAAGDAAQGGLGADLTLASIKEDVPLPLTRLLGLSPQEVEPHLGDPISKGMMKKSCFRHRDKRVFFECSFAQQTYADKSGTFGSVTVDYEDGISSAVYFTGLPGEGPMTSWEEALKVVGLQLPEAPEVLTPEANVTVWSWGNSRARLLIEGSQYRVVVSTINGERARARVEVVNNSPLTPAQEAKVLDVKAQNPGGQAPGSAPTP
ncbi:MAG: hypothetical protein KC420_02480 [Myxococcales bacterium]|nr:hypothetical protein [Myxococcales bacterium]